MTEFNVEIVGTLAAILSAVCWAPQSIKIIVERKTAGLSLMTNLMSFVSVLLWEAYGLLLGSWPMILSNAVSIALIGTILVMKLYLDHMHAAVDSPFTAGSPQH